MKKRGAGNIEFILAFVLFVSFTAAAIYFFSPAKNVQSLESAREYLENSIITNASVELESYSMKIESDKSNIEVEISGIAPDKKVRVVNYSGSELPSKRYPNSDSVCFERGPRDRFVTIYFSEDLNGESAACSGEKEDKIASSIKTKVISEKRIRRLNESYETNYSSLAEQFSIPANMGFAFSLELPGGETISAEKTIPSRSEVFSNTQIKEILREDGELVFGYLTVKVW